MLPGAAWYVWNCHSIAVLCLLCCACCAELSFPNRVAGLKLPRSSPMSLMRRKLPSSVLSVSLFLQGRSLAFKWRARRFLTPTRTLAGVMTCEPRTQRRIATRSRTLTTRSAGEVCTSPATCHGCCIACTALPIYSYSDDPTCSQHALDALSLAEQLDRARLTSEAADSLFNLFSFCSKIHHHFRSFAGFGREPVWTTRPRYAGHTPQQHVRPVSVSAPHAAHHTPWDKSFSTSPLHTQMIPRTSTRTHNTSHHVGPLVLPHPRRGSRTRQHPLAHSFAPPDQCNSGSHDRRVRRSRRVLRVGVLRVAHGVAPRQAWRDVWRDLLERRLGHPRGRRAWMRR